MDTLYWIGLIILFVYSVITTCIVFTMRKDLIARKPKGTLYFNEDELFCELNEEPDEIKKAGYVTMKVVDAKRRK